MAVYKATYCYPFLGSCDIRVAPKEAQWITCKVDSSNKKITGYRITIYDENNKLIFPYYNPASKIDVYRRKDWNISPISELSYGGILPRDDDGNLVMIETDGTTKIKLPSQEHLTNSGMNGSYLNLPFFQNRNGRVMKSANAVYYLPHYQAEYLIRDIKEGAEGYNTPENSANWVQHNDGRYYYNKNEDGSVVSSYLSPFISKLNGDFKLRPYQTVLFFKKTSDSKCVFFIGSLLYDYKEGSWSIEKDQDVSNTGGGKNACVITRGSYHDRVYIADPTLREYERDLWADASGRGMHFSIGKTYKWVITLYQGDGMEKVFDKTTAVDKFKVMDYSNIDVPQWYDMILQKGQILGSCPSRIQLAKYDDTNKEYILPRNKDGSSVILYKTYAQLVDSNENDVGSRFFVNTYSSSLGHVYPLESDAGTISVEGAKSIEFFKHSNNPEAILDTDIVDMATVKEHQYNNGDGNDEGNVELCGIQNIDDVVGENGKYVLVMHQKKPIENGVYKMTDDSSNTISIKVNEQTKTYKRDSSKDEYAENGLPSLFAWTHEKTNEESSQIFDLTVYTKSRYCKKGDKVSIKGKSEDTPLTIESAQMATWIRSGGFTSWSDYIGRIIYVKGGTENGGKNFTSTASSTGTLLKRPYVDDENAATPLYFVPERSVVLFPQLLNDDYSIKALGEFKAGDGSTGDTVDGVILSSGDYYIKQSTGEIWQYKISHNAGESIKSPGENIEYYYVNQGQTNGLQVCKIGSGKLLDVDSKDLNRAEVLKNTATKTYIGQYANLDVDMILRFDDKVVRAKDGSIPPKDYLKIKKVDRVVWSVEHEELAAPFRSYSNDIDEPYYYKICTFYKKSDENPFYFRETPYLIINDGLADGYMDYNNYDRLSVNPAKTNESGEDEQDKDKVMDYDLYESKNLFDGDAETALKNLSYSVTGDDIDGETFAELTGTLSFPGVSKDGTWGSAVYSLDYDLGPKADETTVTNMVTKLEDTYKKANWMAIGAGDAGLEKLNMPAVLIAAAKSKWVENNKSAESAWAADTTKAIESKENFLLVNYAPNFESGYKLLLNGLYKQGNGASWESYRWVLEKVRFGNFDLHGDTISNMIKEGSPELFEHIAESIVIKDTGNRYDKKMSAVFYGLLDNLEEFDHSDDIVGVGGKNNFSNTYLVTLYVTDENGVTKSEKRLFEYKTPNKKFEYCVKSFKAAMDCQKECVKISVSPGLIDQQYKPSANNEFKYLKEFSIFRREYKKLYRYKNGHLEKRTLIGNKWDPVALDLKATTTSAGTSETINPINLLDFNVKSGYSYQYVIFPGDCSVSMSTMPYIYANTPETDAKTSAYDDKIGWKPFFSRLSKPVRSVFQYWSIVNLIPVKEDSQIDADIDTYVADADNVWMFKYQVESGSLTQNISKNELSTLGQYPKIGIGRKNFLSGSVSCYLGSEIIPLSKVGYIERTPASREVPLSTNEKAFMVEKWREFVASGTPKLLRDAKGQSWIVQIMDGSTTTNEAISIRPDTINFSWRQIADTNDVIIYAMQGQADSSEACSDEWREDLDDEQS